MYGDGSIDGFSLAVIDCNTPPPTDIPLSSNAADALVNAVLRGKFNLISLLVEDLQTDLDLQTEDGETALLAAVSSTLPPNIKERIIRYLLFRGASPHTSNRCGASSLHIAASNGDVVVIQILLSSGAFVNARDEEMETPLHWAIRKGERRSAELLIKHGAVIDLANRDNETPLSLTLHLSNKDLMRLLLTFGSRISSCCFSLPPPSHKQMKRLAGKLRRSTLLQGTHKFSRDSRQRLPRKAETGAEREEAITQSPDGPLPWWWA